MAKQINLKKEDLPKDYKSHLEKMKVEDPTWHFDPNKQDNSAKKVKQDFNL